MPTRPRTMSNVKVYEKTDRKYQKVPGNFTDQLCEYILAELANGRTLTTICQEPGMPDAGSVASWALKDPTFARKYLFARRRRALVLAEEIIDIADNEDGGVDDKVKVGRSTLRIKTRQWLIEHDLPELFGQYAERKERPLPVISEQNGKRVLEISSSDPIEAAKEYASIMSATAVAAERVVDQVDMDYDVTELELNVPGDLNVTDEFILPPLKGDLADNDPSATPKQNQPIENPHYENDRPKLSPGFDPDVYIEPDPF